jgi:hypothetical protein
VKIRGKENKTKSKNSKVMKVNWGLLKGWKEEEKGGGRDKKEQWGMNTIKVHYTHVQYIIHRNVMMKSLVMLNLIYANLEKVTWTNFEN